MNHRHHAIVAAAVLAGLAAVFLWTGRWSGGENDDRSQISQVIVSQLEAIRSGDFDSALKFAAKPLRSRFSGETFAIMVRNGYAGLVESTSATILEVDRDHDQASVLVRVRGGRGPSTFFQYSLVREGLVWRISGVQEVADPRIIALREGNTIAATVA